MRRPNVKVLKPAAQHEAETAHVGDDLGDIATEIAIAALAVTGLGEEQNADGAVPISNMLHALAERVRDVGEAVADRQRGH